MVSSWVAVPHALRQVKSPVCVLAFRVTGLSVAVERRSLFGFLRAGTSYSQFSVWSLFSSQECKVRGFQCSDSLKMGVWPSRWPTYCLSSSQGFCEAEAQTQSPACSSWAPGHSPGCHPRGCSQERVRAKCRRLQSFFRAPARARECDCPTPSLQPTFYMQGERGVAGKVGSLPPLQYRHSPDLGESKSRV